jgi:transposase-like protein
MKKKKGTFDYNSFEAEALKSLKEGKDLGGKDGILAPLIKRLVEASLEGEINDHLKEKQPGNRRNGKMGKQVKTSFGPVIIETPRDRDGTFQPETLPKRTTVLGEALDNKVISLYGKGMSYTDICEHLEELYGLTVSPSCLTEITDSIVEDIRMWQNRELESVYPFVWFDAIHYKVKENGAIRTKAVYCVIGCNRQGEKDLLGLYIGQAESASFWLNVMSDLRHRGVEDIFIACIDNLSGFSQAIQASFSQTDVQLCIIHQIRNSLNYVPRKDKAAVVASLRNVYQAPSKEQAEAGLLLLEEQWGKKYPSMVKSWLNNWDLLSNYFKYPPEIRRAIYTTNTIESFNSQLRKITKSKRVFSNDQALIKLIYLVFRDIKKGWNGTISNWKIIMSQLIIIFANRMSKP